MVAAAGMPKLYSFSVIKYRYGVDEYRKTSHEEKMVLDVVKSTPFHDHHAVDINEVGDRIKPRYPLRPFRHAVDRGK